jgi:uncharacterized protein
MFDAGRGCLLAALFLVGPLHAEPIGEAARVVQYLKMEKIPDEGAWYAATYRSPDNIATQSFGARYQGASRVAGSAIYALVTRADFSALHRLQTDEIWHYYRGEPLELLVLYPDGRGEIVVLGSDVLSGQRPQFVVPRGAWQGARPQRNTPDAYTLFGCTLAPGFEYGDFAMGYRDELQRTHPQFARNIAELTRAPFVSKPVARPQADPVAPAASVFFAADTVARMSVKPGIELRELVGRAARGQSTAQSVALFDLAAGQSLPRSHNRLAEETFLIMSGRGKATLGASAHPVGRGDVVLIKPNVVHSIEAAADSPLSFYAISAPAFSTDDYYVEP